MISTYVARTMFCRIVANSHLDLYVSVCVCVDVRANIFAKLLLVCMPRLNNASLPCQSVNRSIFTVACLRVLCLCCVCGRLHGCMLQHARVHHISLQNVWCTSKSKNSWFNCTVMTNISIHTCTCLEHAAYIALPTVVLFFSFIIHPCHSCHSLISFISVIHSVIDSSIHVISLIHLIHVILCHICLFHVHFTSFCLIQLLVHPLVYSQFYIHSCVVMLSKYVIQCWVYRLISFVHSIHSVHFILI